MSVKPEMIRDEFFNDWYLGCPICKTRIEFPIVKNPMDYRPKCCAVCKTEFDWSEAEKKGLR